MSTWINASDRRILVTISIERPTQAGEPSAQPETVAKLLRQLGLHNVSALREADALQAWVRDNVPNQALRVSIRRNGYGFVLDMEGEHRMVFDAKAVEQMVEFTMRRMYG